MEHNDLVKVLRELVDAEEFAVTSEDDLAMLKLGSAMDAAKAAIARAHLEAAAPKLYAALTRNALGPSVRRISLRL